MVLELWDPGSYWLTRSLLLRGIGVIYLVAFLVAARQFRPLAGEDGLLPLERYVEGRRFRERPSLFHVLPDDTAVAVVSWGGVVLSLVAIVDGPSLLGLPGHLLVWGLLWALCPTYSAKIEPNKRRRLR